MHYPAVEALHALSSEVSDLWNRYDAMRARCREQFDWPAWCFAPVGVASYLVNGVSTLTTRITALAAWRMTKGVYRFDTTLLTELLKTPIDSAVPTDVLRRLPEWCVYIELAGTLSEARAVHGVWVWLEPDEEGPSDSLFLGLLFDAPGITNQEDVCCYVRFAGASVLESLQTTFPGTVVNADELATLVRPVISLVLYICSLSSDMTRNGLPARPKLPEPVRTRRRGERLFAAQAPVTWDLGVRIGAQLRAARDLFESHTGPSTGRTVTPHVRTAHWHTFVLGPRKGVPLQHRDRDIRWMPPIPIAVTDLDQMPATVRRVK